MRSVLGRERRRSTRGPPVRESKSRLLPALREPDRHTSGFDRAVQDRSPTATRVHARREARAWRKALSRGSNPFRRAEIVGPIAFAGRIWIADVGAVLLAPDCEGPSFPLRHDVKERHASCAIVPLRGPGSISSKPPEAVAANRRLRRDLGRPSTRSARTRHLEPSVRTNFGPRSVTRPSSRPR